MKSKIWSAILVVAITTTGVINLNMNNEKSAFMFALDNIEALANNEEEGVSTRYCILKSQFTSDDKSSSQHTICKDGTKENYFLNCPDSDTRGKAYSTASSYHCIVKK